MCGKKVIIANTKGGLHDDFREYLLATEKYVYKIHMLSHSSTPIVKDTTQDIFESITFIE